MKTKRFCWILLLNLLVLTAGAEPYETVVLKNGSVLEGYISVQHPGKDIIFFAEKATVYIPVKQVKSVLEYDIEIETLSDPWKAWVGDNPLLVKTVRGSKFLQMTDIILAETAENDTVVLDSAVVRETNTPLYSNWNVVPRKVRILEKGEVIKYLDFTPNSYYLDWKDIQAIKRAPRATTDLTGLIDVVALRTGEKYEGQIIEQIPGERIRLLKNDGIVEVINAGQIAFQQKKKLNPIQSLFEQSPLLDVVCIKKDEDTGIIVEQNYGGEKEPGYLLIQNERGDILRRNSIAVTETRKKANPDYKPLTDVIVGKGKILVNRKESAKAVIEKQEGLLIVDTASRATVLSADSIGGMLIVEKQNESSAYRPILLKLVLMKVKGKGFCNVFTYEDLVTNGVHPQESVVSVNGTLKLSYAVGKGKYILYDPQGQSGIFLSIE